MKPTVMGAEPGRHGERHHDASDSACSPRLVLVPDQLGAEHAHLQLALSVRLVELAEPHRATSPTTGRPPVSMTTSSVPRVWPGEVEFLLAQWMEAGVEVGYRRVQLRHAGVDQNPRIRMVDDVHVDRHPLALGEQVGNEDWRAGD